MPFCKFALQINSHYLWSEVKLDHSYVSSLRLRLQDDHFQGVTCKLTFLVLAI